MGILYLDSLFFDLYIEGMPNVIRIDLSSAVLNLEIVNKVQLENIITNFIQANKIPPSKLSIVLSEHILFVKAVQDSQKMEEEIEKFKNTIPFERVSIKSYNMQTGYLLLGVNQEFYAAIKTIFEKHNFIIEDVAPIYSTGISTLNAANGMDLISARNLLKNFNVLKENSFDIEPPKKVLMNVQEEERKTNKPNKSKEKPNKVRLYALIGVFGILIIVLILVILMTSSQNTQPKAATLTPPIEAVVTPIPQETSTTSATLNNSTIQISINVQESNQSSANSLRDKLISLGFTNTTVKPSPSVTSTRTVILFSPNAATQQREQILSAVANSYPDPLSQEAQVFGADVSIVIGQ